MRRGKGKFAGLLLLLSSAAAQIHSTPAATVKNVHAVSNGGHMQVRVALSAAVNPRVIVAQNPDRLVLELPNTMSDAKQELIPVNQERVKSIRIGLHSATPPVTRIVIDLEEASGYGLQTNGSDITLTLQPRQVEPTRAAPAAAVSGGFLGVFHRRSTPPIADASAETSTAQASPPPSEPPIALDPDRGTRSPANDGSQVISRPDAAHPNRGSLQEGTVFPSAGSPGTGAVPAPVVTTGGAAAPQSTIASTTSAAAPVAQAADSARPLAAAPSLEIRGLPTKTRTTSTSTMPPASAIPPPSPIPEPAAATKEIDQSATSRVPPVTPAPNTSTDSSTAETATKMAPAGVTAAATNEPDPAIMALSASDANFRTVFKVKYVAEGVAYLDGGRSSGLKEGMKLEIKDTDLPARQGLTADPMDPRIVAELDVSATADTSAVTDIHTPKRPVKAGDLAYLSNADAQVLVQQRALSATRSYPAVVTFTEEDPLDEEARVEVPRPPMPSVNRARGRIGLDYMGTMNHGNPGSSSSDLGIVLRADITRIGGTYWNLSGYWRGRLSQRSNATQQTLQDLINRTYHLSMTYDNPNSAWIAGFGRLYLPWAPSLDTIDGGYFGRRMGQIATVGMFAGSTPDPTSWNYNPDRRLAGAFVNFEGGSYDGMHFTSTSGLGLSTLLWQIDRPFVFFENSFTYKRFLSIYDSLQADAPRGNAAVAAPGPGLSRNFFTLRLQPLSRLELTFNHNYFRDIPTFDPQLVGTGLLDKYLFQGYTVGARVEVVKQIFVYSDIGQSNRSGDARNSWNQMYGLTFGHLPWVGLRADAHYSKFNSSFGSGVYRALSLSHEFGENLRLEMLAGDQNYVSTLALNNRSRFLTGNIETALGSHYFVQGGFTTNRGGTLDYDQWLMTFGYRFDSRTRHK